MRTLMKMSMPVEPANRAIQDGTMPKILQSLTEALHPEASYFFPENGRRTALFVFDLKEPSQIPTVVEPLFLQLNAEVELFPVMNAEDLKAGLSKVAKQAGRVPIAA